MKRPDIVFKNINEEAEKNIKAFGFHVWYLTDKENTDSINCFTQGLEKTYGHKNLQLTLPLEQEKCANIFYTLVEQIKSGITITPNNIHRNLLKFPVLILEVPASKYTQDLDVLRIIIPDKNGKFAHEEECDPHFKKQLD